MRADRQPAPLLHRTVHATAADPEFAGHFAALPSNASTSPAFAIAVPARSMRASRAKSRRNLVFLVGLGSPHAEHGIGTSLKRLTILPWHWKWLSSAAQ